MSSHLSTNFGTFPPGTAGSQSLSIALIGPDQGRRRTVSMALAEDGRTTVSEFESYPKRSDELRWLIEQSFDVILLDLDGNPETVLDLVGKVSANEAATVMVYSEQADTKLAVRYMRAGAREYLLLPLEDGIMAEALDRAREIRVEKTQPARGTAGNLFSFVCAKGGCGSTTVACNLAVALAADSEQKTLLIDLALPIGDAALALGITAQYSTEDAIRNAARLDGQLLNDLVVKHRSGLYVLAAPSEIPGIEDCGDAIEKLIAVARGEFDHVIVDVGSRLDLMGTSLFKQASTVYLVTLSGVSELRNSNRLISQFFPAGGPNLEVVINRFESRLLGVKEDDLAKALGRPVRWTAPEDRDAAREMQYGETGTGSTRIARLGADMAAAITGRAVPQEKKRDARPKGRAAVEEETGEEILPSIRIAPPPVEPATPVIHWQEPAPITFGDALSLVQLNATASVPGALVYTPAPGNVLPAGTHELTVHFTPTDSENYTTAQATVQLEVAQSTPDLSWADPDPIIYGTRLGAEQLNATASVPGRFEYSPAQGEVLAAGKHTLAVEFIPEDSENYATVKSSVSLYVKTATPVITWPSPDPITYGTPLSVNQLCAATNVPGKFEYSVKPGEVLEAGVHTLTASFVPTGTANYTSVETSVELVVDKAMPVVSWPSPDPIPNGTPLSEKQLCAASSVPGRFDYSPEAGVVLAAGTHRLSVTFTPADTENYAEVNAGVTFYVAKARPVVEWSNPDPIRYGTKLSAKQLCATASVAGKFDYTPALGEVLAAGTHTLSATFIPADSANYAPVRATVSLEVAKAIPSVEWPAPHSIRSGTALGEQQLCATSPLPGTFEYNPGPGRALLAGTHRLSVTFTPTDTANYATTHATVSIKVVEKPAPAPSPNANAQGTAETQAFSAVSKAADSANSAAARDIVSHKAEKAHAPIEWPTPEPIRQGKPLRTPQIDAPATFIDPLAEGEVLVPRGDARSAAALQPEVEQLKPAPAKAEPKAETVREAPKPPAAARPEKAPEPVQKAERIASPAKVFAPSPKADVVDPLDWLTSPEVNPARPVQPVREVSDEKSGIDKKWILMGAGALVLLLVCGLVFFFFAHSRAKERVQGTVTQVPVVSDTEMNSDGSQSAPAAPQNKPAAAQAAKPEPGQTDTAQTEADASAAEAQPSEVQTDMMRNQLNAPARIPQGVQKQATPNAPPPTNFSAAAMGGNNAMNSVFGGGKAPAVVAAPPRGPVAVPGDIAMRLLVQKTLPQYPSIAKQARVSGTVQLEAKISKSGTVETVRVVSGPAMLRDAALYAVRSWRYRPYVVNNQPVEIETTISVAFSLNQ